MWSVRCERLDVFLGTTRCALAGRDRPAEWIACAGLEDGLTKVTAAIADKRLGRWRKPAVHVVLAGSLARPFFQREVRGLRGWAELLSLARAEAPGATGLAEPCAVRLGTWKHAGGVLGAAVETTVLEQIESSALESATRVCRISPWWSLALNHVLRVRCDARVVALDDGEALTLLGGEDGGFDSVRTYSPRPTIVQEKLLLERSAMTVGVAIDQVVLARRSPDEGAAAAAIPFGVEVQVPR